MSEPVTEVRSDGLVSVTTDLQIVRHMAEIDEDWVEVIPYEAVLDPDSGEMVDLVVHDLDYEVEHQPEDPLEEARLMRVDVDMEGVVEAEPTAMTLTQAKKAVAYALKYALTPNKAYKLYGTDCTNFVSQALYAGRWKEVGGDRKSTGAWWQGSLIYPNSWSWSAAENFY